MRSIAALFALVLVFACAACKTSEDGGARMGAPDESGRMRSVTETSAPSSGEPGALDYVALPFENVVYLPWKFVGGALKGAADGVGSGFAKDNAGNQKMPILGILFSPVNLVLGFLTGAAEGLALPPGVIGPTDDFGRAMGGPMRHPTSIWWY
jgi:hypothetical protein